MISLYSLNSNRLIIVMMRIDCIYVIGFALILMLKLSQSRFLVNFEIFFSKVVQWMTRGAAEGGFGENKQFKLEFKQLIFFLCVQLWRHGARGRRMGQIYEKWLLNFFIWKNYWLFWTSYWHNMVGRTLNKSTYNCELSSEILRVWRRAVCCKKTRDFAAC